MENGVLWGHCKGNAKTFGQPENIAKWRTTLVLEAEQKLPGIVLQEQVLPWRHLQVNTRLDEDVEAKGERMSKCRAVKEATILTHKDDP